MSNVECITPSLQTLMELEFQKLEEWAVGNLRSSIWEADFALTQTSIASKNPIETF